MTTPRWVKAVAAFRIVVGTGLVLAPGAWSRRGRQRGGAGGLASLAPGRRYGDAARAFGAALANALAAHRLVEETSARSPS
jgi:hypothetical protein